jgi:phenylpropionate dioxygenase-like ring-hydroxylating dioxygenase large terminal subunit
MFKNFWYALAFSDEITTKPSRHRVLAQDLVMWRNLEGRVRVLSDTCIHRGGSLSGGWTEDDVVVCPYHGWGFDGEGVCTKMPANRGQLPVSKKARVDAYPVEERHGWVWVFMGDDPSQSPPIPDLSILDDPSFRGVRGEWLWDGNYERVVENGTDVAHTPWVHGSIFGNRKEPEVTEFDVESGEWHASLSTRMTPRKEPSRGRFIKHDMRPDAPKLEVSTMFHFPSIVMIHIKVPRLGSQIIWDTNIPLDEHTTLTKYVALRQFAMSRFTDFIAKKQIARVFEQDDVVVRDLKPELIPEELRGELHLKSDVMSLEYRRCREQAVARGWSVLGTAQGGRDRKTVIPGPSRRQPGLERAWVFEETPAARADG